MDNNIHLPGHGLVLRPELPERTPILFGYSATPFDWSQVVANDGDPTPNQFDIPDKDQDGSGSCTCQTAGYGFFGATGIDVSRRDPYSHVALPGGGAYLDAPYAWFNANGYLVLSQYPDPNPESENAMTQIITVADGQGRIKKFKVTSTPLYPISIDAWAQAVQNHTFVALGIAGSWSKGWNQSWTDPSYQGQNDWQHALYTEKRSIVIRKGKKAAKAKSSWTQSRDFLGQPSYCHYINEDYFNAGGVFEILAVDIKEITQMNETIYTILFNGKAGLLFQGGYGANIVYANNEAHYQELGDAYGKKTCWPDPANPGKWQFAPFDITINVPTAPAASN